MLQHESFPFKIITENLFETIFDTAPDALVVVNEQGRIVMVNSQVNKLFGYEKEELIGNEVELLIPVSHSHKHKSLRKKYSEAPVHREMGSGLPLVARRKDGTEFYAEISLSAMQSGDELYISAAVRDVTEKKKMLTQLLAHEEQINEQNKRLMNFAHMVSHNLRSYASNTSTMLSLLEKAESPREKNEIIGHLKNISTALNETIHHLSEVVAIQTSVSQERVKINLREYIEKTIEVLSGEINKSGAVISNHVSPDVNVLYNPAYMESIILNFLSNSLKYRHPNRQPTILVESFYVNGRLVLKISDNGLGIDLIKYGSKLFSMHGKFHENPDARGIGLFITKNQVEAMGGKIDVTSEPNKGTSFTVYLS